MARTARRRSPWRRGALFIVVVLGAAYVGLVAFVSQAIVAPPRVRLAESARPVLGVVVAAGEDGTVTVRRAVPPASVAGLRAGDRLVHVDGATVTRPEDVVDAVAGSIHGEWVRVHAERRGAGGEPIAVHVDVEIEIRPVSPADVGLPYEDLAFTDARGRLLRGWFIPAPVDTPGPAPGVVYGHGNGGDRRQWLAVVWEVHRAGFAQLLFDFAGRGESEGEHITLGPKEAEGLRGALDAIASRPEVDGRRLALVGRSMGASAAILAGKDPRVRALVLDSPFAELGDVIDHNLRTLGLPPGLIRGPLDAVVAVRGRFEPRDVRPVDVIPEIRVPVLLVHGESDSLVPVDHARRLEAAAGGPVELLLWPGLGHNDPRPTDFDRTVAAFLARSVP